MTEQGILSILRRGTAYHVHYASSNPYTLDSTPYPCPDEGTLIRVLQHCGLDPWAIQHARAELRHGRMAVVPLVCTPEQRQAYFPPACAAGVAEGYV